VGNNADHFSAVWATTPIILPRYDTQLRKKIGIVDNNEGKHTWDKTLEQFLRCRYNTENSRCGQQRGTFF
jgi:hypothetical protein